MLRMECFILTKQNAQETYPQYFPVKSPIFQNLCHVRFQEKLFPKYFMNSNFFDENIFSGEPTFCNWAKIWAPFAC